MSLLIICYGICYCGLAVLYWKGDIKIYRMSQLLCLFYKPTHGLKMERDKAAGSYGRPFL